MDPSLTSVAVYRRSLPVSLERVLENVHDWEHLPWLHHESFRDIALLESGAWGWRARVELPPGDRHIALELVFEDKHRYVARTLEGGGAGTEIWTTLDPRGAATTGVEVEFRVPGVRGAAADELGLAYTRLYTRLWDQDEAMMTRRTALLGRPRRRPVGAGASLELGTLAELRAALPRVVELDGHPFRIVDVDGDLVAHSTLCPHSLGPLDAAEVVDGEVACPWHGYRFDVRSGCGVGVARRLRLLPAPRVVVDPDGGRVRLVAGAG